MNKKIKIAMQGLLFLLIIAGFIYVGTRDFSSKVEIDNEKFDNEYTNVSKDNVFTYINGTEVLTKIKNGSGIIFLGYPKNKWSGYYASILNEAAHEAGIKEILYYNFSKDREDNNGTYGSIVIRLSSYLVTNDKGKQSLNAPALIIVKNGKIIAYDDETSLIRGTINPSDYWSENKINLKTKEIKTLFKTYIEEE